MTEQFKQKRKKKLKVLDPIQCAVCKKTFVPKDTRRRACSRSCGGKLGNTKEAREKGRQTRLERYGDPNFNNREKVRRTVQEKYGKEYINPSQVPEIKKKIVDTYTERHGGMGMASKSAAKKTLETTKKKFGVENDESIKNVWQIDEIKEKIKETHEENWGGIGFASEELAERSKKTFKEKYGEDLYDSPYRSSLIAKTFMEKYGTTNPYDVPEFQEKAQKTTIERHGGLGGNVNSIQDKMKRRMEEFRILYEDKKYTLIEISDSMQVSLDTIRRWARNLGIELPPSNILNESWRLLLKKETEVDFELEGKVYGDNLKRADLYNEEFKLAIEINPTITHSTQPTPFHGKKVTIKYHQERAISAEENGWNLIQVFDWDKPEDIIKLVKSFCNVSHDKIYARKCEVREVEINDVKPFIELNHRSGTKATGNIAFGLFYKGELVQTTTFSKERFVKDEGKRHYELIRMCSKEGTKVIGGASKLLKAFINSDYKPNRIKTFVDYSKGQGKVYEKMGMKYKGLANLNGLYANIDTGEAYKVTACTSKFKKEYEKLGMTQQQYMNSKRFYRINDAGNKIFEWNRNEK